MERITVEQLNRRARKKRIWCVGCGKRLLEILNRYKDEPFVREICGFVDNNSSLWGTELDVQGRTIQISGKGILEELDREKDIVIITSDASDSIFASIANMIVPKNVEFFLYPEYYWSITEPLMRFFSVFVSKKRWLFYCGDQPHENADLIVKYIEKHKEMRIHPVALGENTYSGVTFLDRKSVSERSSIRELVRFCYYYSSSMFLFYENSSLRKVNQRQKLVFLNHGTIPLKKVSDVLRQKQDVDFGICPAEGCAQIYVEQYGIPLEKQIYCMPARTAELYNGASDIPWIDEGEKIIVWLPTFRKLIGSHRVDSDENNPVSVIEKESEWKLLNNLLEQIDHKLIIKLHPREAGRIDIGEEYRRIRIITDQDLVEYNMRLNMLLAHANLLLTDYSGIAFEYLLLNRPIGYIVSDMEQYKRGFAIENPIEYMPGKQIYNFVDLCDFLLEYEERDYLYQEKRMTLRHKLYGDDFEYDGAEKLVQILGRVL